MKRDTNRKQREAIASTENTVVSAGAGSGKTYVLTERFFRLITEEQAEVQEILTLTFTKKAASEMFERIYRRLLAAGDSSDHIRKQIQQFDQAQISTLDSFCAQIARTGAGLFGMTPDFSIDDPASLELSEQTAFHFLLHNAAETILQAYITDFGFERVWKDLFSRYGYSHASVAVKSDFTGMEKKQHAYLIDRFHYHGSKMIAAGKEILQLDRFAGKAVAKNQDALSELTEIETYFKEETYEKFLEKASSVALSKVGTGNSKREAVLQLKDTVDEFKEQQEMAVLIARTLFDWPFSSNLFSMFENFEQELVREKRKRGICGFHDVLTLSIEILKKDRSIRDYYKSMFRFVMIDEFQDNNGMQKELLYLLAEKKESFSPQPGAEDLEPGKLFFVGDDKQSIYRFRGADVRVFKDLREELTGPSGTHIDMELNYRSNSGLIHFFNRLFQTVLQTPGELERSDIPAYEAMFRPLEAGCDDLGVESKITLLYKPYDREEAPQTFAGGDEAEAYTIASLCKEYVEEKNLFVRDKDSVRPAEYGDIALLMRSTSNQVIYERIFRQLDIPYVTDNVRTLFLEAPFNDFYNILQLSLFPGDKKAYAALLRSPFVGCSDDAVLKLLLLDEGPFPETDVEKDMDTADRNRYIRGKQLFQQLREKIGHWSIGRIVNYLWYEQGYRYTLLTNPGYHPYLEYFDYLYYLAVDADKKGMPLSQFIDFLRRNLGKYERLEDLDVLKEKREGIQLLTIHKSKGLEFPIVVLANTGNVGNRSGGKELFYISEKFGITFTGREGRQKRSNYFYSLALEEEKKMELAEIKRLLYVACTRAKDHLVVSGYHHRNNKNSEEAMLNMVLESFHLSEDCEGELPENVEFRKIQPIPRDKVLSRLPRVSPEDLQTKISKYFQFPLTEFQFDKREFSVTELAEAYVSMLREQDPGNKRILPHQIVGPDTSDDVLPELEDSASFGTLVHYAMEKSMRGSYRWEEIPYVYLEPFSEKELPKIQSIVDEMVERFFSSSFMEMYRTAREVRPECDFILRYLCDGLEYFVFGRMDLLFETEDRTYIIDFKTDRSYVPALYETQLQLYVKAAEAMTGKSVECFLFFLRTGTSVEVFPDRSFVPPFPKEGNGYVG